MAAKILMVLSASIILMLGVVHLVYTFWGPMLRPRDPALQISMSQTSPVITKEMTMWRCWIGFNATHSMGLILFGLVFAFLALAHGQILFRSPLLLAVGLVMLGGYVVLCKVSFSVGLSEADLNPAAPPKTLREAEKKCRSFLRRDSYPEAICWLIPGDVVTSTGPHYRVRKPETEGSSTPKLDMPKVLTEVSASS